MANVLKQFGCKMRKMRAAKKLSQEELAYKTGLHRTYISDIERGQRNVSLKNIKKIIKALDIKCMDLID